MSLAAKTPKSNPGRRLMRARQKRRLTRADTARRLSVDQAVIKYLDQWELDKIDGVNNLKDLVRQYALLVGLSPSEIEGYLPIQTQKKHRDKKLIVLSKTSIALGLLLLSLVAVGFVFWRTITATTIPQLSITFPPQGYVSENPSLLIAGSTSERAQIYINGIATPVNPDGSFSGEIILSKGANTIEVIAINSFSREAKQIRTIYFSPLDEQR